jgi:hypothetical protein
MWTAKEVLAWIEAQPTRQKGEAPMPDKENPDEDSCLARITTQLEMVEHLYRPAPPSLGERHISGKGDGGVTYFHRWKLFGEPLPRRGRL